MARIKNKIVNRLKEIGLIAKTFFDMNEIVKIITYNDKKYVGRLVHVNDSYLYIELLNISHDDEKYSIRVDFSEIETISSYGD